MSKLYGILENANYCVKQDKGGQWQELQVVILNKMVRLSLPEKINFEERFDGGNGVFQRKVVLHTRIYL